jgi:hypothetical protein
MKYLVALTFLLLVECIECAPCLAQTVPFENVILVTLDGLRGEEVFRGADNRLITKENGVAKPDECKSKFWREGIDERRRTLMPFLWDRIEGGEGWIAGDPDGESLVAVTNGLYFSYPGYNELLSGFADPWVNTNDKRYNRNVTVLEWLHDMPEFQGKIAAYGSWDVFPFIINDQRSGIPVNAGWQKITVGDSSKVEALNFVSEQLFHEFDGVRYDSITALAAIEEMRTRKPRVLYVSLGETDDWAHAGRYDRYLLTAQQNDRFLKLFWETAREIEQYRDKTLLLITTDHGRGDGREGWKNHSVLLNGSERIWIAAIGPGLSKRGIDREGRYEQAQIASTVAASLGRDFTRFKTEIKLPLPIVEGMRTQKGAAEAKSPGKN